MKKFLSLIVVWAALTCMSRVYAQQPQFWITQHHGIDRINLDGSGHVQATSRPSGQRIGFNQRLFQASDGSIYEIMEDTNIPEQTESLYRITSAGAIKIREFNVTTTGLVSSIAETSDGRICGVISGPSNQNGFVFVMNKNGSNYKQTSFTASNAFLPTGDLLKASNGSIYGQSYGDQFSYIYKIKSNFSGIDVIRQFPLDTESEIALTPINLTEGPDGFLYGFTDGGYIPSVLFKISLDGQQYTSLLTLTENFLPVGKIVFDDNGTIFGEATTGQVFKVNRDGSNLIILHQFASAQPSGSLYIIDNILYSNTMYDTPYIFSIDVDGSNFQVLHTFPALPAGNSVRNLLLVKNPLTPDTYLTNPGNGSITANVAATYKAKEVKGSLHYKLELSETIDFATVLSISSTSDPLFNLGPLKFATKYYARVSCTVWPGFGPTTSFTTKKLEDYCFISKPVDGAIDVAAENLKVTANLVSGASIYTIELSTTSNFSANVWTKTSTINNQRTLVFSGLPAGELIYARAKTNVCSYGKVSSFHTLHENAVARFVTNRTPSQSTLASPNPFKTNFVVSVNADASTQIVLIDATGRVLFNQTTFDQSEVQLGDGLANGIYFVKIVEGENVTTLRMSKQ
jgi:hypothetical protein